MHHQHLYKQIDSQYSIFYGWFSAMHSRVDIALCNLAEKDAGDLFEMVYKEVKRIEIMADRFDEQSEISKINRLAAIEPYLLDEECFDMLNQCLRYNSLTSGAFDITVNSVYKHKQGVDDIVLDPLTKSVFFNHPDVRLDLCGYIKGYALDRVRDMLLQNHCADALINIGNSSVCGLGNHPHGKGWQVRLPRQEPRNVTLHDECLSNSGNSTAHLHIIDPESGNPVPPAAITSVITKNATDGEVLSTSLCVCKPEFRSVICENLGGRIP
jgi:FAD:protein FMN transferase